MFAYVGLPQNLKDLKESLQQGGRLWGAFGVRRVPGLAMEYLQRPPKILQHGMAPTVMECLQRRPEILHRRFKSLQRRFESLQRPPSQVSPPPKRGKVPRVIRGAIRACAPRLGKWSRAGGDRVALPSATRRSRASPPRTVFSGRKHSAPAI